jgi:cell division septum initiation protein DivIVA
MALPKSVQRQLDEADAIASQQNQPPQQEIVTDASQLPAPAPAQASAPAPSTQPQTPAPAEPPAPAEDWQQKFRTVQGMYQAEVPQLRAQNKQFEAQLAAAREQLTALSAAVTKAQTPATEPPKAEIDPRDARAFGEDMVEMVNRYAQKTFASAQQRIDQMVGGFDKRLSALEKAVTGVSQRTETTMESQFYATLEQLVPDWKTVNTSPKWLEWLAEVDEVYNVPRQTALDVAFERRDAPRVAAVFKQFARLTPPKPADQRQTLVTPSEGGGGPVNPPAPPPNKPMISQKFVQQFYTDEAKGRYRGREAEFKRIEAEINLAAQEGRIV